MMDHKAPPTTWKPCFPYLILAPGGPSRAWVPSQPCFDSGVPASRRCKGPEGLNPRKTTDTSTWSRRKSELCLPPGTSRKRIPRSLSLETSVSSPTGGSGLLIYTVDSRTTCPGIFQKTQGAAGLGERHLLPQRVWGLSLIHDSEPTRQAAISYAVFSVK